MLSPPPPGGVPAGSTHSPTPRGGGHRRIIRTGKAEWGGGGRQNKPGNQPVTFLPPPPPPAPMIHPLETPLEPGRGEVSAMLGGMGSGGSRRRSLVSDIGGMGIWAEKRTGGLRRTYQIYKYINTGKRKKLQIGCERVFFGLYIW